MSVRYRSSPYYTTVKFADLETLSSSLHHIKKRKLLIIDKNVLQFYEPIISRIFDKSQTDYFIFEATEENKNLASLTDLLKRFVEVNITRSDYIFAIGGGITLDLAGFAASIFKRGCRLVFIPTTFVAMIDASIGGKNGINYQVDCQDSEDISLTYKNLLGSFYPPEQIVVCPQFLETLSKKDILNGWAECIKVSLLIPNKLYHSILRLLKSTENTTPLPNKSILRDAITLKEKLCRNDLYDRSMRRKLNLGHSFAHLIETASNFEMSHGESVALGIMAAAKMSMTLERIDEAIYQKIIKPFSYLDLSLKLPAQYRQVITETGVNILTMDKKNTHNIKAVIFAGFQSVRVVSIAEPDLMIDVLLSII